MSVGRVDRALRIWHMATGPDETRVAWDELVAAVEARRRLRVAANHRIKEVDATQRSDEKTA